MVHDLVRVGGTLPRAVCPRCLADCSPFYSIFTATTTTTTQLQRYHVIDVIETEGHNNHNTHQEATHDLHASDSDVEGILGLQGTDLADQLVVADRQRLDVSGGLLIQGAGGTGHADAVDDRFGTLVQLIVLAGILEGGPGLDLFDQESGRRQDKEQAQGAGDLDATNDVLDLVGRVELHG